MKIHPQLILSLAILITSCTAQIKPIGESPLQLKSLDLNLKITDLLPDKYKSKQFDDYYDIPSDSAHTNLLKKEIIFKDPYSDKKTPKWIEYHQQGSSSVDTMAVFDKFVFNTMNIVTTPDNKLMVFNGLIDEVGKKENDDFIRMLDGLYGNHVKTKGEFAKNTFDIYTWKLSDRTIKYAVVYDDESNTMKIEVDKVNNTIQNAAKEPHYQGYIYIIDKAHEKEVVGQMGRGDLIFCK